MTRAIDAERRTGYVRRVNAAPSRHVVLQRREAWRFWSDRWEYGPTCDVPPPVFAPGVASFLAAALFGKGGDPV